MQKKDIEKVILSLDGNSKKKSPISPKETMKDSVTKVKRRLGPGGRRIKNNHVVSPKLSLIDPPKTPPGSLKKTMETVNKNSPKSLTKNNKVSPKTSHGSLKKTMETSTKNSPKSPKETMKDSVTKVKRRLGPGGRRIKNNHVVSPKLSLIDPPKTPPGSLKKTMETVNKNSPKSLTKNNKVSPKTSHGSLKKTMETSTKNSPKSLTKNNKVSSELSLTYSPKTPNNNSGKNLTKEQRKKIKKNRLAKLTPEQKKIYKNTQVSKKTETLKALAAKKVAANEEAKAAAKEALDAITYSILYRNIGLDRKNPFDVYSNKSLPEMNKMFRTNCDEENHIKYYKQLESLYLHGRSNKYDFIVFAEYCVGDIVDIETLIESNKEIVKSHRYTNCNNRNNVNFPENYFEHSPRNIDNIKMLNNILEFTNNRSDEENKHKYKAILFGYNRYPQDTTHPRNIPKWSNNDNANKCLGIIYNTSKFTYLEDLSKHKNMHGCKLFKESPIDKRNKIEYPNIVYYRRHNFTFDNITLPNRITNSKSGVKIKPNPRIEDVSQCIGQYCQIGVFENILNNKIISIANVHYPVSKRETDITEFIKKHNTIIQNVNGINIILGDINNTNEIIKKNAETSNLIYKRIQNPPQNPLRNQIKFGCYSDFKYCNTHIIESYELPLYNHLTNYSSHYYHNINITDNR